MGMMRSLSDQDLTEAVSRGKGGTRSRKPKMHKYILVFVIVLIQLFNLATGAELLCAKKLKRGGCGNYPNWIILSGIWSDLRCQAACLVTSECSTMFLNVNGPCYLYRAGCLPDFNADHMRYDLAECESIRESKSVKARIDTWDVIQRDFNFLYRWFKSGEYWTPPDATEFVNSFNPLQIDDFGTKILRIQTFYQGGAEGEIGFIRFKFGPPSGIVKIVNVDDKVESVCNATYVNIDGSRSCDMTYTLAANGLLKIEAYSAKQVNPFTLEILTAIGAVEISTSVPDTRVSYPLPERPVIVMNKDQIVEISNELLVLRPTITGSLPITGYWSLNGVRVSDTPSAITVDTRSNQLAYGLYQLHAENQFGSASFHVLVKPPFEGVFSMTRVLSGPRNRMQFVEISHNFSGADQSVVALFSEINNWIASLTDAVLVNSSSTQLKVLGKNITKHGGLSLATEISFETMANKTSWNTIWYRTKYNYSLLANVDGYLGGMISFIHMISDSIVWVYDLNTSISTSVNKAAANFSVVFEDKGINARNGKYPYSVPFNVTVKVTLDEESNRPIYNVVLGLQTPTNLIDVLYVTQMLGKCYCTSNITNSKGLIRVQAKSLNFEEAIEVQVTLISYRNQPVPVPLWITLATCASQKCARPDVYVQTPDIYIIKNNGINMALRKTASQSSTLDWQPYPFAPNAVDGNTNTNLHAYSCAATADQGNPWWQVDLNYRAWIEKVILYNRMDYASSYLSNARVMAGDSSSADNHKLCGKLGNMEGVAVSTVECPSSFAGRYVRITIPSGNLMLCEVQVMGNYVEVNLALGRPATQSSVHRFASSYVAANAVDGNTNRDMSASSCAHTDVHLNTWWQVDLEYISYIRKVTIYNRIDCCSECLNNVTATVSYDPTGFNSSVCGSVFNMASLNSIDVECQRKLLGRYVRLTIPFGTLAVCEVMVMGSYDDREPNAINVSYIWSNMDKRFFICGTSNIRKEPLCFMTENQGSTWKALPSNVYDIRAYDENASVLEAIDEKDTVFLNVGALPWNMYCGMELNPSSKISRTILTNAQLYDNDQKMVTTQIGLKKWLFNPYGIKENGYYIFSWGVI